MQSYPSTLRPPSDRERADADPLTRLLWDWSAADQLYRRLGELLDFATEQGQDVEDAAHFAAYDLRETLRERIATVAA